MRYKLHIPVAVFLSALLFLSPEIKAQDTVRVMMYNPLRYGEAAEPPATKNPLLKTTKYVQPDLFGANEIAPSNSYHNNILVNVLNTDGVTSWKKGTYSTMGADQSLSNGLFYNSEKFVLAGQKVVSTVQREITAYQLYYNDSNLAITHDTVFLTVLVAHLKAGNEPANASQRALETQQVVNWLNAQNKRINYIMMGDFNLYTSSEAAYQNLITNTNVHGKLYDPINKPGTWPDVSFAPIHTQSSRGGSFGGLDDRFDFQLCNIHVLNDSLKIRILPETYKSIGNDGLHYNTGIVDAPANSSAPAGVLSALSNFSDHLPVRADYVITPAIPQTGIYFENSLKQLLKVVTPVERNIELIAHPQLQGKEINYSVINAAGKIIQKGKMIAAEKNTIEFDGSASRGLYLLQINDQSGRSAVIKLIKR